MSSAASRQRETHDELLSSTVLKYEVQPYCFARSLTSPCCAYVLPCRVMRELCWAMRGTCWTHVGSFGSYVPACPSHAGRCWAPVVSCRSHVGLGPGCVYVKWVKCVLFGIISACHGPWHHIFKDQIVSPNESEQARKRLETTMLSNTYNKPAKMTAAWIKIDAGKLSSAQLWISNDLNFSDLLVLFFHPHCHRTNSSSAYLKQFIGSGKDPEGAPEKHYDLPTFVHI